MRIHYIAILCIGLGPVYSASAMKNKGNSSTQKHYKSNDHSRFTVREGIVYANTDNGLLKLVKGHQVTNQKRVDALNMLSLRGAQTKLGLPRNILFYQGRHYLSSLGIFTTLDVPSAEVVVHKPVPSKSLERFETLSPVPGLKLKVDKNGVYVDEGYKLTLLDEVPGVVNSEIAEQLEEPGENGLKKHEIMSNLFWLQNTKYPTNLFHFNSQTMAYHPMVRGWHNSVGSSHAPSSSEFRVTVPNHPTSVDLSTSQGPSDDLVETIVR